MRPPIARVSWHAHTLIGGGSSCTQLVIEQTTQRVGEPFETRKIWKVPVANVSQLVKSLLPVEQYRYDDDGLHPITFEEAGE